jgi:hypothetical protein
MHIPRNLSVIPDTVPYTAHLAHNSAQGTEYSFDTPHRLYGFKDEIDRHSIARRCGIWLRGFCVGPFRFFQQLCVDLESSQSQALRLREPEYSVWIPKGELLHPEQQSVCRIPFPTCSEQLGRSDGCA